MQGPNDPARYLRHDDLLLVERIRAGDEAAFATFFDNGFHGLYRFALARLDHNRELAKEVAQSAMCIALEKLHTYRGEAPIFSWLCTICRFEISAHFRRERRTPEAVSAEDSEGTRSPEMSGALDSLASTAVDPEAALLRREVAGMVHRTVDHLPSQYGAALEWRYADGLSVSEIATRLEVSYKAAESILSRARQAFKDGFTTLAGWLDPPPRNAGERS